MDSGTAFIIMLGCTFFVIFEGTKALWGLSSYQTRVRDSEQIFNSRIFEKEETVREKLNRYFHALSQKTKMANLSFVFAYIMISLMLHMITPGSSVWASFGVVSVFFLGPLAIGISVAYENRLMKKDIMEKLNARL